MYQLWDSVPQSLLLQEKNKCLIKEKKKYQGLFFKLAQSKSSDTTESTSEEAEETVNVGTPGKNKTIDKLMVDTHNINAEILWFMKFVKSHYSYNSCSDFTKLLTKMCPDSDIATKIKSWKNKMSVYSLWASSKLQK